MADTGEMKLLQLVKTPRTLKSERNKQGRFNSTTDALFTMGQVPTFSSVTRDTMCSLHRDTWGLVDILRHSTAYIASKQCVSSIALVCISEADFMEVRCIA